MACALLLASVLSLAGCSNNPYPDPGDKKVYYGVETSGGLKGLDPAQAGDTTSGTWCGQLYDALYEYHYLKRPYELQPALADGMPRISEDGLVWTIGMKKGVTFHDNECFTETGGEGREATVHDVIYSFKRTADPANKPRWWWMLSGRIVGLDAFHDVAVSRMAQDTPVDYSADVEGLKALDDYTLQVTLTEPWPQFRYVLAMSFLAAVPHEAVEYYKEDFVNNPVGTGPFMLKEWSKRWRIILERNPDYRDDFFPTEGEEGDAEKGLLDAAGERLPFVDRVYITMVAESQPAWLYFVQGYRETSGISKDNYEQVITPDRELSEEFREKGVELRTLVEQGTFFTGFNMHDPVVGGDSERARKLRQAMSLAYDTDWRIRTFDNDRAINAQTVIPPGLFGYDEDYVNPYKQFNVDKAKQLMTEAGYPGGINPETGKKLQLDFDFPSASPAAEQYLKAFRDDMAAIGIEVTTYKNTWPEFQRKMHEGRVQVFGGSGWVMDYPDPENFLQLFYGPNKTPGSNSTNYENPEYDRLYEKMKSMPDSPERLDIIHEMRAILTEDCPAIWGTHRISFGLKHQWVRNSKPHDITGGYLKYIDLDVELRTKLRREWNKPNYTPVVGALAVVLGLAVVFAFFRRTDAGLGGPGA